MIRRVLAAPFRLLIQAYRLVLSPLIHALAPGSGCRFQPTCSQYALDALRLHPLHRALWLTLRRLARCHPWGGEGEDPVPPPRSRSGEVR
jgi:putative membrane protein insertion efficiency factor